MFAPLKKYTTILFSREKINWQHALIVADILQFIPPEIHYFHKSTRSFNVNALEQRSIELCLSRKTNTILTYSETYSTNYHVHLLQ